MHTLRIRAAVLEAERRSSERFSPRHMGNLMRYMMGGVDVVGVVGVVGRGQFQHRKLDQCGGLPSAFFSATEVWPSPTRGWLSLGQGLASQEVLAPTQPRVPKKKLCTRCTLTKTIRTTASAHTCAARIVVSQAQRQ